MPETLFCPRCHAAATTEDAFCTTCGAKIDPYGPAQQPAFPQAVPVAAGPGAQSVRSEPTAAAAGGNSGGRAYPSSPYGLPPNQSHDHSWNTAEAGTTSRPGLLAGLFDFRFLAFVTPRIITILYVLVLIGLVLTWLFFVVSGFDVNSGLGGLALVLGPLVVLFWLAVWRVTLELMLVLFRISEDLHAMREQQRAAR
ncbi:DUF4282 domain-containing protein [Actinocrinis puniceicyclus]|uniref:DUF4282 domain-containing protein n=1 Tax=Actinocrinis puniceicyclus TaxID=977794 RepID=A0A8J7WS61_9ACTN|nr:DUF4282 domain-containing protein [Actinocrinis puniceicyclus]MBS2964620.1 DUF4282 domain-containing protein [Actinocrinis puniceicyclus]